ncbi:MAG: hypothetical protein QM784_01400 [Polyangiaceae bacterium]
MTFPVPNTDFGLVDALRAGHPNARRVLCDRHSGELLSLATRIFGPRGGVTAFVVSTLQRALERLDELQEPRELRLWLLKRLVDAARWTLRFDRLRYWFGRRRELGPRRARQYSTRLLATYRVLDGLAVEQRLAFCLVVIHSMRISEAATILNRPIADIERTLARAHAKFTRVAKRTRPQLLHGHSSHASLGAKIAGEQDRSPSESQLYESDLFRLRDDPSWSA